MDLNTKINIKEYSNSGKNKLLAIHGMGTYSGWFQEFYSLTQDKIDLISFDLIGFGQSGKRGKISSYNDWVDSIEMIWNKITTEYPDKKCFLLGHSFGAVLAILALKKLKHKPNHLILTSPGFGANLKTWNLFEFVIPTFCKGLINYPEYVSLPIANEVIEAIKANIHELSFLTPKVQPKLLVEMLKASTLSLMDYKNLNNVSTLMILAGNDEFCDNNLSKLFFKLIQSDNKKLNIIENAPHDLFITSCLELKALTSSIW